VAALVAPWCEACSRHRGQVKERRPAAAEACASTPRQLCWLLLKAPDDLTADEQAYLTRLYHACLQVAVAEALVEEFGAVLPERDVEGLYTWLRGAEASGIKGNCKGTPGVSGWIVRPSRRPCASTGATGR
jgi:hypothetical protein